MSDETNFNDHFYDIRKHQPKRGQVMARYAAVGEFIDGSLKRDVLDLLMYHESPETAVKLMRKVGCATERDSVGVPLAMARDLLNGMSREETARKPYRFVCEAFFYTQKEHIPLDPHWTCVNIHNLDEFLDANDQRLRMQATIIEKPSEGNTYAHDPAGSNPGKACVDDIQAETGAVIDCEPCG
jgi:hypothetical protein